MAERILDETERLRLEALIGTFAGPAPWYLPTFPRLHGHVWEKASAPAGVLILVRPGGSGREPVLSVPRYGRALAIAKDLVLTWTPGPSGIDARCYAVSALRPVDEGERDRAVAAAVAPIASAQLPHDLSAGRHDRFGLPALRLPRTREIFLITDRPEEEDGSAVAIYVWRPGAGTVDVLPQRWFTGERMDLAYQWITRAGRDPVTDRIVGDGIRVGCFELDESGTDLAEFRGWFGWEWRHGTGPPGAESM